MTKNKVFKRFQEIASGQNTDASDEYYTLYHSFMEAFIEVLCRHDKGNIYKVIICPCDSETSVFRELEKYAELIGNPKIIYSFWPEKDWREYFDMDYQKEYGCKASEVLIFTNPPFKGLSKELPTIKCDYILFGSNAVGISGKIHAKETRVSLYRKNNLDFDGNADNFKERYGRVATIFYSNKEFLSTGKQWINTHKNKESMLFGKDRLKRIK